ncbi:EAL domain-containing protein [Vibrio sp. HDW18]|uniref:putative bifunctional diguanylate cyclase/phosphodiesterase n=1 Tax=Vibrio sp. HDW18 TaxID=2714948 RepID=UPI0014073812|nr:EAL domain-containing protein [Vibrio sp. HDW18]QIL85015.1 EAL domain-containing protein [Vibrio sp. HDW18]
MTQFRKFHSLAFKQAKSVFLVSVLLGLGFSLYHTLADLHDEQAKVQEYYNIKLAQSYKNASQAAYNLNNLQAEQVATALMLDPGISKVEIVDDFGDVMSSTARDACEETRLVSVLAGYLTPEVSMFSMDLHQPNSDQVVGKLSFYIDGFSLARMFIARTTHDLLFDLLRNILLTSILLIFFYQKLSLPLTMLINWVNSLNDTQRAALPTRIKQNDELSELASTFQSMWQEKELAESKLNQLAYYDSLTGLANRRLLLQKLSDAIETAENSHTTGVLFYLDLDRFKTINDSLGHTIGDQLLKSVAQRMDIWAKNSYLSARIGGDEFVVLIPYLSPNKAEKLAKQLLKLISNSYTVDDHQLYCTASIGIAIFPALGCRNIDVLRQADTALYRAKASGRNKFVFYEPEMQAQVESFLEIEKGLHEALKQHQLELYYQPQVDEHGQLIGVEALIRWHHPKRGLLSPGIFMPIAEETGLILSIGHWIIEQACYQYAQWKKQGILPTHFRRLAINISPLQFAQDSFIEQVKHILQQTGITGEQIEFEITEGLLLENVENALQKMAKLKESQISISIDDFGTGYSSLRYLKDLAIDALKIDRSFVNRLHLNDNDQAIVDTILAIARKLDLEVIAEGVEDVCELAALKKLGCKQFQGYLFDKPLRAEEIAQRFISNSYAQIDRLPLTMDCSKNMDCSKK